jgi:hypothetical protein
MEHLLYSTLRLLFLRYAPKNKRLSNDAAVVSRRLRKASAAFKSQFEESIENQAITSALVTEGIVEAGAGDAHTLCVISYGCRPHSPTWSPVVVEFPGAAPFLVDPSPTKNIDRAIAF